MVDTALIGASGFPSLLSFADPSRIVFGTDFPYASEPVCNRFIAALDAHVGMTPIERERINRGAGTLFPRLARAANDWV